MDKEKTNFKRDLTPREASNYKNHIELEDNWGVRERKREKKKFGGKKNNIRERNEHN